MDDSKYWSDLASDYLRASVKLAERLAIPMCIGEFETNNGRSWPGTYNIGAVQLAERQVPADLWVKGRGGQLPVGTRFSVQPGFPVGGVLHVDTHPTENGPVKYYAWFAAFTDRPCGITYFLLQLNRISNGAIWKADATVVSVVTAMYMGGYFEGNHAGARPLGHRVLPLTSPEQANVNDYVAGVNRYFDAAMLGIRSVLPADTNTQTSDPVIGGGSNDDKGVS
jgi:hypothetical protein